MTITVSARICSLSTWIWWATSARLAATAPAAIPAPYKFRNTIYCRFITIIQLRMHFVRIRVARSYSPYHSGSDASAHCVYTKHGRILQFCARGKYIVYWPYNPRYTVTLDYLTRTRLLCDSLSYFMISYFCGNHEPVVCVCARVGNLVAVAGNGAHTAANAIRVPMSIIAAMRG